MTVTNTAAATPGSYAITVQGTSSPSGDTENFTTELNVYDSNVGSVNLTTPINGATNQASNTVLGWDLSTTASGYEIQISESPNFGVIVETTTVQNINTYQTTSLSAGTVYYWRIRPSNPCTTGVFGDIFSFQTANDVCITYDNEYFENGDNIWETGGANAVSARVDVPDNIILNDVSFYMQADHGNINHIKMQFSSPEGRFAEIYNRDCSGADFDVTFSDAGTPLTCGNVDPMTVAGLEGTQQASQLFTRFHGENAQGTWVLLATDRTFGTGGTFNEFSVTICGELQTVNDITLANNNTLIIAPGQTLPIPQASLEASQPGAVATDLTFTVTRLPSNGTLLFNGVATTIGQMFTQDDINNNLLSYNFTGAMGESDDFVFSVTGNNGALLGGQIFNIVSPTSAPPMAVCQDITVDLGATGQVTITAAQIDNGSTDDGTITAYSLDVDTFDCSMVGTQTVTLTVTDNEGQSDTCTATVTVTNNTPPANLNVTAITASSAVVSWNGSGADSYDVRYRIVGAPTWTTVSGITTNTTTLTGLISSENYEVQVRANCIGGSTAYSASENFTTTVLNYCAAQGNNASEEFIGNVTIGDINNSSNAAQSSAGYTDYTGIGSTDLEIGTIPTISVTKNMDWRSYL